ncbi:MAG: hypothetical protein WC277_08175 [Bacilli bacterium]
MTGRWSNDRGSPHTGEGLRLGYRDRAEGHEANTTATDSGNPDPDHATPNPTGYHSLAARPGDHPSAMPAKVQEPDLAGIEAWDLW